ncbi:MAG: hypothetical protein KBI40_02700 [Firmicutes bacterium]|nr:hypothetical protein [Candidatus Fermentithermobacillaceae bacterium]
MVETDRPIEQTREHLEEGRHFLIRYEINCTTHPGVYSIKATLMEKRGDGQVYEIMSSAELSQLDRRLVEQLLRAIQKTQEPVFPVHLPDIARDLASQTMLENILPEQVASP